MSRTILIVDDNIANRLLFQKIIGIMEHKSIESTTGLDTLELSRTHRPDLILMDIGLPETSGLEITRKLKSTDDLRHIPVVAVTAFASAHDRQSALDAGCVDYITKPIDIQNFIETLKLHLGPDDYAESGCA